MSFWQIKDNCCPETQLLTYNRIIVNSTIIIGINSGESSCLTEHTSQRITSLGHLKYASLTSIGRWCGAANRRAGEAPQVVNHVSGSAHSWLYYTSGIKLSESRCSIKLVLSLLSLSLFSHTALSLILSLKLQASQTFGAFAQRVFPFRPLGLAEAPGQKWREKYLLYSGNTTVIYTGNDQRLPLYVSVSVSPPDNPGHVFLSAYLVSLHTGLSHRQPWRDRAIRCYPLVFLTVIEKTPKHLKKGCMRVTLSQWHGLDENNNKQKDRKRDDMRNDTALHFASVLSILSAFVSSAFLLSFSNAAYLEFNPTQLCELYSVVLPSRWRYSITACQMWWNKSLTYKRQRMRWMRIYLGSKKWAGKVESHTCWRNKHLESLCLLLQRELAELTANRINRANR